MGQMAEGGVRDFGKWDARLEFHAAFIALDPDALHLADVAVTNHDEMEALRRMDIRRIGNLRPGFRQVADTAVKTHPICKGDDASQQHPPPPAGPAFRRRQQFAVLMSITHACPQGKLFWLEISHAPYGRRGVPSRKASGEMCPLVTRKEGMAKTS